MSDSGSEHERFIPRPPPLKTSADFVVAVFVITIATILLSFAIGTLIGGFLGEDVKPYVAMLTDIMGSILGALVGFIAGKGMAQTEGKP